MSVTTMTTGTTSLLTVAQVARQWHLQESTIRTYIKQGRLPAQKTPGGKNWLIREEDAERMMSLPTPAARPAATGLPGVIPAGADPLSVHPGPPFLDRLGTPEGRARALAMLDSLLDGDEDEQRRSGETLQRGLAEYPIRFRRWNIETGERTDDEDDSAPADSQDQAA